LIALAFLSSEEDSAINQWHVLAGWIAALLVVFRIAWGFIGGEHSRFSDFVRPSGVVDHIRELRHGSVEPPLGHNPLGGIAVLLLIGLTAVTVWTGAFGGEAAEELHELIAWALLAMVALHVVAVVAMSLLQRENLARAMVTGQKPAERHPGARDAKEPGALAWLLGGAVIVATSYLILQYDPDAFTPRSAESFEHRADRGGGAATSEPADDDDDE
jgi:cytochrome b